MESDSEIEDLMSCIDPNESDFFDSDDEYVPSDLDENDSDDGFRQQKPKIKRTSKAEKSNTGFDDEDDVPLAVVQQSMLHEREAMAAAIDEDIMTQMFEEPVWIRDVPLAKVDSTFIGELETPPDEVKTQYDYFRDILTNDMLENIEKQTNFYAMRKKGIELNCTRKEIEKFIGVYLRMGLMKAYCRRAYWALLTRYPPVADVFKRNQFDLLSGTIHFTDNDHPAPNDRVWKLRPWLNALKINLEKIPPSEHQSVDEIMIAFKGKSVLKQYNMRNKPHKWGFKVWARAGSDRILHDFSVYQGSSSAPTTTSTNLQIAQLQGEVPCLLHEVQKGVVS